MRNRETKLSNLISPKLDTNYQIQTNMLSSQNQKFSSSKGGLTITSSSTVTVGHVTHFIHDTSPRNFHRVRPFAGCRVTQFTVAPLRADRTHAIAGNLPSLYPCDAAVAVPSRPGPRFLLFSSALAAGVA